MPKKTRCSFKECKDAAQRIAGDCAFCSGHFCGKHRLLEDHKCAGLEDVSRPSSSSPSPPDREPTAWWLVGLRGLVSASSDEDVMLANAVSSATRSARRRRTSRTPPSSRPSGPKSSKVSKRRTGRQNHKSRTGNRAAGSDGHGGPGDIGRGDSDGGRLLRRLDGHGRPNLSPTVDILTPHPLSLRQPAASSFPCTR